MINRKRLTHIETSLARSARNQKPTVATFVARRSKSVFGLKHPTATKKDLTVLTTKSKVVKPRGGRAFLLRHSDVCYEITRWLE
jgi:hypothetical protein